MSTKFTKGQREGMVQSITREAFTQRFDAIAAKAKAEITADVATRHEPWLRAREIPEFRPYVLSRDTAPEVEIGGRTSYLYEPTYLGVLQMYARMHISDSSGRLRTRMSKARAEGPYGAAYSYTVSNGLRDEYVKAWDDYNAAYSTLLELFKRYTAHEALVKDFPEYKDYLPAPAVSASVPMLAPEQVRFTLTQLGVPAEEKASA